MTFNKQQSGFTLIELLVVVAIIGILSSIVLAALGSARQRARLTSAQATLSQVRAQAELDYPNDFSNVCGMTLIQDAIRQAGLPENTTADCNPSVTEYAVSLPVANDGASFCVDSTGFAGEGFIDGNDTVCTRSN